MIIYMHVMRDGDDSVCNEYIPTSIKKIDDELHYRVSQELR